MKRDKINHIVSASIIGLVVGFGAAGISSITVKEHILEGIFAAMVGASLSFFLQFTYVEGHIFNFYYRWLERLRENKNFGTLSMPLGLCAYCQNIWLTTIAFAVISVFMETSWWMWIPSTAFAHVFLSTLDKLFWQDK